MNDTGHLYEKLFPIFFAMEARFFSPSLLAAVYFAAGDADKGFASLQASADAKVRDVIFLRTERMLDGFRDDPRYLELFQVIGF